MHDDVRSDADPTVLQICKTEQFGGDDMNTREKLQHTAHELVAVKAQHRVHLQYLRLLACDARDALEINEPQLCLSRLNSIIRAIAE